MGIYIKRMSKPKNCRGCYFNESDLSCLITKGRIDRDDYICDIECPIIEPCKDAISREWMLNELEEMNVANFYEANFHSNEVYGDMKQMIKDAPPVTVEPKQGEWIITEQDNGNKWWTHRKCSECGGGVIKPPGVSAMKFCPNCGARMKGAGDD